ncbi:MAG: hypothetical protein ACKPKO_38275, partial [Candidatus Fonsibacter sp.]
MSEGDGCTSDGSSPLTGEDLFVGGFVDEFWDPADDFVESGEGVADSGFFGFRRPGGPARSGKLLGP